MCETELSKDETELYDRQIRLWGIESQQKLRAANVLLIGIRGLGSEIAKNILLSGINSLTILDDGVVTEDDIAHNFLLHEKIPVGKKIAEEVLPRAQALNPLVKVNVDTEPVSTKSGDYFKQFNCVVATKIKFENILKIDNFCREYNVKFIQGDVCGFFGYSVVDLQEHEYYEDRIQLTGGKKRSHTGERKVVRVEATMNYPALTKVLILPNTKQDISGIKKLSRPNNLFIILLALLDFRRQFDRDPNPKTKSEDIEKLKTITDDIIKLYQYKFVKLDNLYELLFGELPPVCAVLGGIIAQEVIKAVSHKEVPINNVFLFDPVTYNGRELTVGV